MLTNKILTGLALCSLFVISSCDECEEPGSPHVKNQEMSVQENSTTGTVIGVVEVGGFTKDVYFEIVGGDPDNAFAINPSSGEISVSDSTQFDYEKTTRFELAVRASTEQRESTGTITINLTDMIPTTKQLVARYTFASGPGDYAGNGNDGIDENISYVGKNGFGNLAADFPGYGNIVFPQFFDFPQRTVSVWVLVREVDGEYQIIYSSDSQDVAYGMTILSVIHTGESPVLTYNVSNILNTIPVQENVWYNAVFVVDGKNFSLFLNGEKFHEQQFTSYIGSASSMLDGAVLGSSRAADRYFRGRADDLRIYDRALTEREVELIYFEEPQ
jgi:hypothetical protein